MTYLTRTFMALGIVGLASGHASAAAQQQSIVPPAPAELLNRRNLIVVRISDVGMPSINNQPIPWSRLNAELKAIFAERPEKILFIEVTPANREVDVRRIAAAAKQQGIRLYDLLGKAPGNTD